MGTAPAVSGSTDTTSGSASSSATTAAKAKAKAKTTTTKGGVTTTTAGGHASSGSGTTAAGPAGTASAGSGSTSTGNTSVTVGGIQASTPTTKGQTVAVCVPVKYDPPKPVNLCGMAGVTPAEQARAEALVRATLLALPKYADWHVAYNAGYRSINDGSTGDEHFVNWAYVQNDGHILDPNHPESLVYDTTTGGRVLVAAMFMMNPGTRFHAVPDVGGNLTQWHEHNDLCLRQVAVNPLQLVVAGLSNGDTCPSDEIWAGNTPMLHVWIVHNKCGPFAALDGIGGGNIPPGQTRLCDTIHGM